MKRWKLMDKLLYISLGLMVLFAWFDSQNIIAIKEIDQAWRNCALWDIFWGTISPALFTMWAGVLIAIGLIWYLYSKDKSEAIALAGTPLILLLTGVQDMVYYIISPDVFTESIGCWADVLPSVKLVSNFLGEACPTAKSFTISAILGIFLAYNFYKYMREKL